MDFEKNTLFQALGTFRKKIHYESQTLDQDTVLNIPDDTDLVILNHSFTNNHTIQQYDLLKNKVGDRDFVYLTSNYYYWKNKHPNIIYFNFYYFFFIGLARSNHDMLQVRPYKLMCLNLNPWLHRTINFLKMSEKKWFAESKISFHWTHTTSNSDTEPIGLNTLAALTLSQKKKLTKFQFPIIVEDNWRLGGQFYVSNTSKLYGQTMINYVTENSVNQEFTTEKIWQPIFSGQLFYVLGSKNYLQHLRDIGIDVFDDIINHNYDIIEDLDTKIDSILNDLDKVLEMNLDKIWHDTYQRRKNNFDLVNSEEFRYMLCEDLIKRIS